MKSIKKKSFTIFLAFLLTITSIVPAFATNIVTTPDNSASTPVQLTADATTFNVSIPTGLPVHVDATGEVTVATDNRIINDSFGPVEIVSIDVEGKNEWTLVDFTTDFSTKAVNLKEFGFELNEAAVPVDGNADVSVFPVIPGEDEIKFTYDSVVATQTTAMTDFEIARVVFTIGWSDTGSYRGSSISVTAQNENGEDLKATSYEIVGNTRDDLLSSLEASDLIVSADEVDALIEVNSNDFDGMAETTFHVSDIAASGDTVVILHYNEDSEKWEYVSTEIVDADGNVTADFSSYSPVAFVVIRNSLTPGLYDSNNNLLCSWEDSGIDITQDYKSGDFVTRDLIIANFPEATKVVIPSGTTYIGKYMFDKCESITNIVIPETVTTIGGYAFYRCYNLENVNLPKTLTEIPIGLFWHCNSLKSIDIPDSVIKISSNSFLDSGLTSIDIPDTVPDIYKMSFRLCNGLTELKLPNSLKRIDQYLADSCDNLAVVYIPAGVSNIGEFAFADCPKLTTIYYGGTEEQWEFLNKGNNWHCANINGTYVDFDYEVFFECKW